jgi:hypothetical protein
MLRTMLQAGGDDVVGTVFECSVGAVPARVVVVGQQVITATFGSSAPGLDALVRVFLVDPQQVQQRTAAPSLVSSLSGVPALGSVADVLVAVDAQIEQLRRDAAALGGMRGGVAVQLVLLGNQKDALPDDVQRLARLADGTRDVGTLLVESTLPPATALRALSKLVDLGIVARTDARTAGEFGRSAPEFINTFNSLAGRQGVESVVDRRWLRAPVDHHTPTTASSPPGPGPVTPSTLGTSSLPASVPHPRAQRSLADDEEFFGAANRHAPPSSLPLVLAVVAALVVVVVVVALLVR